MSAIHYHLNSRGTVDPTPCYVVSGCPRPPWVLTVAPAGECGRCGVARFTPSALVDCTVRAGSLRGDERTMTTKDMKDLLTMLEALRLAVLDEPSQSDQMAARVFPRSSVPPANFPDILLDEDARAKVLDAIEGQPVTELGDALLNADISLTFQINGDSVIAAAFSGTLAKSLSEAGHIHVHAGVVHAACPGSGRATVQGSTRRMARSFWPL